MTSSPHERNESQVDRVKRLAAIKLEADLHAYLDALAAAGVEESDAIALARATMREAVSRAPERRRTARQSDG